ncbi:Nicotinamidase-related amidase [Halobacillus karajensis]|uniref:Isochorismatase family protein YecD n=1 Tax=Halobacillus karajensis TaxID=195088 RepID=A0A024P627_9BACI|nr:isochorismatase family cysteine hydrolase [Halobacillus karajensis]CDQ20430.1 Isochorismatase family protein YecD [Halobacillus karajensis]CDQ24101.1 Isochorismatase family protein YecD [Halobacillus karajensis]CDQ27579.1 Isochorismatase family protein YecD [Halobacillus karajensis]SEH91782.1 Nicotinamidase-related amidase [Halobacillus karajensis]
MGKDTALIIIDMINKMDFDGGDKLLENSLPVAERLHKFKKEFKKQGFPVIYVNDNFGLWQDNVSDLLKECKQGRGKPIVERMIPDEDDYFIIKPKHSGFFGTQLSILLDQLGIKNLILTGVAGDICVIFTANDAYMREFNLWVPVDGTASEYNDDNENALRIMKRSLFARTEPLNNNKWQDIFNNPE